MNSKLFFIFVFSLIFLSGCTKTCIPEVCFENNCFEVEIPSGDEERMQGLMHREYLPEDKGMLFVFEENGKHSFWMKNTLISLDMIWLDEDFKVVHIENAVPCKEDPCKVYRPDEDALYVLEINKGLSEQKQIIEGNFAKISLCD